MPQSYSGDLRERVIGTVESGASRREAADLFEGEIMTLEKPPQRGPAARNPLLVHRSGGYNAGARRAQVNRNRAGAAALSWRTTRRASLLWLPSTRIGP